jgi:hypothetical protein
MLERFFQWGMRHGARLLFGATVAILLVEFVQAVNVVASAPTSRSTTYAGRLADGLAANWPNALPFLFDGLATASLPFFCALVIQRSDLWKRASGTIVAATAPSPSSWLARHGARLLLALSVVYFLVTTVLLAAWLAHASLYMPWIGPLWSGSVLLFASLALDRIDRWLATVRPYSD